MRRPIVTVLYTLPFVLAVCAAEQPSTTPPPEDSFFAKSLHYTNHGIEFVYSKEQGGVERILGVSASKAECLSPACHVTSCDVCHKEEAGGKASYTVAVARSQKACAKCHGAKKENDPDVHVRKGMACMDCHTKREIHGDGTVWDCYLKPGTLDAKCANCHAELPKNPSHAQHAGNIDCGACHVSEIATCFNCHYETSWAGGKEDAIRKTGLFFLVNHGGKVKLANFMTHVYGNKTMITVAPVFKHSVTSKGRPCEACHGTEIARQVADGTFAPIAWKDGQTASPQGVVPVVQNMTWNLTFFGRENEKWVPLQAPEKPLVNFAGECSPLTAAQLGRMQKPARATAPGPTSH